MWKQHSIQTNATTGGGVQERERVAQISSSRKKLRRHKAQLFAI